MEHGSNPVVAADALEKLSCKCEAVFGTEDYGGNNKSEQLTSALAQVKTA